MCDLQPKSQIYIVRQMTNEQPAPDTYICVSVGPDREGGRKADARAFAARPVQTTRRGIKESIETAWTAASCEVTLPHVMVLPGVEGFAIGIAEAEQKLLSSESVDH